MAKKPKPSTLKVPRPEKRPRSPVALPGSPLYALRSIPRNLALIFTRAGAATPERITKVEMFVRGQEMVLSDIVHDYDASKNLTLRDTIVRVDNELSYLRSLQFTRFKGYLYRVKRHLRWLREEIVMLDWQVSRIEQEREQGRRMKRWVGEFIRDITDDLTVEMRLAFPDRKPAEITEQEREWRVRAAHRFPAPPPRPRPGAPPP